MTGKTVQLCEKIKKKLINQTTKQPEFKTNAEVVEVAVRLFYDKLMCEKRL